jgi:hypothetical protein
LFDLLLDHSEAPHHSLKFGSVQMQSLSEKGGGGGTSELILSAITVILVSDLYCPYLIPHLGR